MTATDLALLNVIAKRHRLRPLCLHVLLLLMDGDSGPMALAKRTFSLPVSIARAVGRLEDRGFVNRSIDRDDKRRFIISITPRGKGVVRELSAK